MTTRQLPRLIARMGFDLQRLQFALRTAAAACLTLVLGWLLGLEHPQWAAMTVWITSQPIRGHLLEKGLFRLAGTVIGTLAGLGLLLASQDHPWVLVVGLAIWVSLCAGIGNVQRGFVSYGTILAGYSAALVALLAVGHPNHMAELAVDRLATVLLGVAVALALGWWFAQRQSEDEALTPLRQATGDLLQVMAQQPATHAELSALQHGMLGKLAGIDNMLDPLGAGSLRSRHSARDIRAVLAAQIHLVYLLPYHTAYATAQAQAALAQAAELLSQADKAVDIASALTRLGEHLKDSDEIREGVLALATAWQRLAASAPAASPAATPAPAMILHRDWVHAREVLLRAACAILAVGGLWLASGWEAGPYMLLGVSVMVSLFSTFDNPAATMRTAFFGQMLGVLGALACRWLVWPHAQSEMQLMLFMMPFIILGAAMMAHRRSMLLGFDYNMVLLLLLQPALPLTGTFTHSLSLALAMLLAPVAAAIAYRYIAPPHAQRRLLNLLAAMNRELESLAKDDNAPQRRHIWRARLNHRLLRLTFWAEKNGREQAVWIERGLVLQSLGQAIFQLRNLEERQDLPADAIEALRVLKTQLPTWRQHPEQTAHALLQLTQALPAQLHAPADMLRLGAEALLRSQSGTR